MGYEIIQHEGEGQYAQCQRQQPVYRALKGCVAYKQAYGYARLPPQYECALRSAPLAVTAQLDEEKQESRPDDAYSASKQQRRHVRHYGLRPGEHGQHRRCHDDEPGYHFALQLSIAEHKSAGNHGQAQASKQHCKKQWLRGHRQQQSRNGRDDCKVGKQQRILVQLFLKGKMYGVFCGYPK